MSYQNAPNNGRVAYAMECQRTIIEANMYSISVMLVRYSLTAKMAVF